MTVFSRDLKYMLDARYSAAPLRRRTSKRVIMAWAVVAMAVAVWGGSRWLKHTDEPLGTPADTPRHTPRAALEQIQHPVQYTQTEQSESKAIKSSSAAESPETQIEPVSEWKTYAVQRGDTLGTIFSRFSLDVGLASRIAKHETGGTLKKLLPEHKLHFGFNDSRELVQLRYELNRLEGLLITFEGSDFEVMKRRIPTETRERSVSQTIGSSLFVSASEAGLSDRLIMQMVSIFGWDIDFALDIRAGDRFSILYEEMLRNGKPIGTGDIMAAEFINNGTVFHAVRHVGDSGRKQYYDLEGNNLRGTFLRTPMRISRITSGFSKRRFHPVLKQWRAHRGVDYGAPTGTPVLATGDGRVHFLGRNGGYGKAIVLKHGGQYSTLYAHLSGYKKGMKKGVAVRQGQVIGYVGSTGLATGPHLHYEFRVNGTHRNPLTYETPKAEPIPEHYREAFLTTARERIGEISDRRPKQLAAR